MGRSLLFYTFSPIKGEINKILPCPALARRMLPDALIDFCSRGGAWPRPEHAYQIQVSRRQPPQLATPHDSLEAKGKCNFFFLIAKRTLSDTCRLRLIMRD